MAGKPDRAQLRLRTPTRREFLKNLGRIAIAGGLGLLGFRLIRKARASASSRVCQNGFYCRTCAAVGACALPQALSFRDTFGGKER